MSNNKELNISKQQALNELWRRGALSSFKLDKAQKDFDKIIKETNEKIVVILCSRRLGKTYGALCIAIAGCLLNSNYIVKFVAPTKAMLKDIIEPIMVDILKDCPEELQPEYIRSRSTYRFHNGSLIQMAGTDSGNAERLRGGFSHLCIVDEAQSCNDLTNTIRSILIPTTTTTKGKVVLLGTMPEDEEHEFNEFIEIAARKDVLYTKTIYDSTRVTAEEINTIAESYPGGKNDPIFRREYLCEKIKNSERSALPEFTDSLANEIIRDTPRPPFYDYYEAMDLGGKDLTVVLFGHFDFRNALIVIDDEVVMDFQEKGNNIKTLTEQILEKERQHYSDPIVHEVRQPFLRVSDIDYIAINEIRQHSNGIINFQITKKDEKVSAVNNLRIMLNNKRIVINPRCKTLINHLRYVKWSKSNRSVFDRSVDNGHYDAVDALIYLIRSIVFSKNPYPAHYGMNQKDLFVTGNGSNQLSPQDPVNIFKQIFNVGKKYGR